MPKHESAKQAKCEGCGHVRAAHRTIWDNTSCQATVHMHAHHNGTDYIAYSYPCPCVLFQRLR
jgi:hypothetical protein